MTKKELYF